MRSSLLSIARSLAAVAVAAVVAYPVVAAQAPRRAAPPASTDWPQWRGPDRTDVSKETGLLKTWPAEGPKLLWKAENLGGGYTTPSVAKGRVYGMGYRGEDEMAWALDMATGKEVWSTKIAAAGRVGYGEGSRSTPTVDADRVYLIGVSGDLTCLNVADGKVRWQKNLVKEFGAGVPGWGFTESPLVDAEKVIATPGGSKATLVAFNKMTGDVIWATKTPEGDAAHYSSAIVAEVDGQRQYVQFLQRGVVGVSAKEGKFLWRYSSPANGTANISTPIYRNNHIFAASAYNTGGGLAKLTSNPDGTMAATEVYFTKRMQNHHGGMVLVGDHLYGFDNSNLTCIDFMTGDVKWNNRSVGKGAVTYADGMLYVRGEGGEVALVEATPTAYVEKGRFSQPDRAQGKAAWAHPVVSNGRLFLRDQDIMLCYDVKGQ